LLIWFLLALQHLGARKREQRVVQAVSERIISPEHPILTLWWSWPAKTPRARSRPDAATSQSGQPASSSDSDTPGQLPGRWTAD